jgi:hypothetical protein
MVYLINLSTDQYLSHIDNEPSMSILKESISDEVSLLGGGSIIYYSVEFEQDLTIDDDFLNEYG